MCSESDGKNTCKAWEASANRQKSKWKALSSIACVSVPTHHFSNFWCIRLMKMRSEIGRHPKTIRNSLLLLDAVDHMTHIAIIIKNRFPVNAQADSIRQCIPTAQLVSGKKIIPKVWPGFPIVTRVERNSPFLCISGRNLQGGRLSHGSPAIITSSWVNEVPSKHQVHCHWLLTFFIVNVARCCDPQIRISADEIQRWNLVDFHENHTFSETQTGCQWEFMM